MSADEAAENGTADLDLKAQASLDCGAILWCTSSLCHLFATEPDTKKVHKATQNEIKLLRNSGSCGKLHEKAALHPVLLERVKAAALSKSVPNE